MKKILLFLNLLKLVYSSVPPTVGHVKKHLRFILNTYYLPGLVF